MITSSCSARAGHDPAKMPLCRAVLWLRQVILRSPLIGQLLWSWSGVRLPFSSRRRGHPLLWQKPLVLRHPGSKSSFCPRRHGADDGAVRPAPRWWATGIVAALIAVGSSAFCCGAPHFTPAWPAVVHVRPSPALRCHSPGVRFSRGSPPSARPCAHVAPSHAFWASFIFVLVGLTGVMRPVPLTGGTRPILGGAFALCAGGGCLSAVAAIYYWAPCTTGTTVERGGAGFWPDVYGSIWRSPHALGAWPQPRRGTLCDDWADCVELISTARHYSRWAFCCV